MSQRNEKLAGGAPTSGSEFDEFGLPYDSTMEQTCQILDATPLAELETLGRTMMSIFSAAVRDHNPMQERISEYTTLVLAAASRTRIRERLQGLREKTCKERRLAGGR